MIPRSQRGFVGVIGVVAAMAVAACTRGGVTVATRADRVGGPQGAEHEVRVASLSASSVADALSVAFDGDARTYRIERSQRDAAALVAGLADAMRRGAPVAVTLDGDRVAAVRGAIGAEAVATPRQCSAPPGPPLFSFVARSGDALAQVITGSQRVKLLRVSSESFGESLAKLTLAWQRRDRTLSTEERPLSQGTDEILAVCIDPRAP
jgi:hypothetical protein